MRLTPSVFGSITTTVPGETATKSGYATGTRVPSLKRNTKGFVSRFSRSRIKFEFMVSENSRSARQVQLRKPRGRLNQADLFAPWPRRNDGSVGGGKF